MTLTLGNIAFQLLSLAVLGAFCLMIAHNRAQVVECLKNVFSFSLREETGLDSKRMYDRFLAIALTLGVLSLGIGVVKVAVAILASGEGTMGMAGVSAAGTMGTGGFVAGGPITGGFALPHTTEIATWIPLAAVAGVALVAVCVALLEAWMLRVAGSVTLSHKFTGMVIQSKKNWMAALSLAITPLVALWTGVNPVRDSFIAYILVSVTVAMVLLFAAHTLRGFINQKVSVLVWFLYLCTVEIFPVCAIVVVVAKIL